MNIHTVHNGCTLFNLKVIIIIFENVIIGTLSRCFSTKNQKYTIIYFFIVVVIFQKILVRRPKHSSQRRSTHPQEIKPKQIQKKIEIKYFASHMKKILFSPGLHYALEEQSGFRQRRTKRFFLLLNFVLRKTIIK